MKSINNQILNILKTFLQMPFKEKASIKFKTKITFFFFLNIKNKLFYRIRFLIFGNPLVLRPITFFSKTHELQINENFLFYCILRGNFCSKTFLYSNLA